MPASQPAEFRTRAGVTISADGTLQAIYNGWPLYFHNNDLFPGDHNGQGQADLWWVIDASGDPVGKDQRVAP